MAESKIPVNYIYKEYTYGTMTIQSKETLVFNGINSDGEKPPWSLNGKSLFYVIPYSGSDYIALGYNYVSRNISAYNGYSQSQNITVKCIAVYK